MLGGAPRLLCEQHSESRRGAGVSKPQSRPRMSLQTTFSRRLKPARFMIWRASCGKTVRIVKYAGRDKSRSDFEQEGKKGYAALDGIRAVGPATEV